jgi:hypothetical protein
MTNKVKVTMDVRLLHLIKQVAAQLPVGSYGSMDGDTYIFFNQGVANLAPDKEASGPDE